MSTTSKLKLTQSIELSLETTYVPDWELFEGCREALQNSLDSEDEGYPMEVQHHHGVLSIKNEGAQMGRDVLLLGRTTKAGTGARGQFGEGLKLGCLGLIRAGHPVSVDTGSEVLVPALRPSAYFPGRTTLWFDIFERPRGAPPQVEVIIRSVSASEWKLLRQFFLRLSPPKETVRTGQGTLLLDRSRRGRVYVRGIFVTRRPDLKLGYDLQSATIDRDRNMVESYSLASTLAKIHAEAADMRPEVVGKTLYRLLKEEAADVGHFHYGHGPSYEKAARTMASHFIEEHGEKAVPVRSIEESRKIARFGHQGVTLPHGLLETILPAFVDVRRRLDEKALVTKRYSWSDLSARERASLERAGALLEKASPESFSLDRVQVVRFKSLTSVPVLGMHDPDTRVIEIDRSRLASPAECLSLLVHEVAHDAGDDLAQEHIERIEDLNRRIYEQII